MTQRRRTSRKQQQSKKQTGITRMQIGLVGGLAIIMVLAFVVFTQGSGDGGTADTAAPAPLPAQHGVFAGVDLSTIPTDFTEEGAPALGSPDAPVTIVEYSDYQCSHCANFAKDTVPEVVKNYVTSGQVRLVHHDAAILGEQSQWAAQAAHCAADQGRFWEYHELLFQKQGSDGQNSFSKSNLKKYAADLGLDSAVFDQCLDQNKYSQLVVEETQGAKGRGVKGTPSFFVNDEFFEGNVPYSQLKSVIDKHLEGAS